VLFERVLEAERKRNLRDALDHPRRARHGRDRLEAGEISALVAPAASARPSVTAKGSRDLCMRRTASVTPSL
jgi:hypothetical protein